MNQLQENSLRTYDVTLVISYLIGLTTELIQEISPILHLADYTWRTRRSNLITGEISHIGDFSCNMFNKELTWFF